MKKKMNRSEKNWFIRRNKSLLDVKENSYEMDLKRYNELMEQFDPSDPFNNDMTDIKYELNSLHGRLWGKGINPETGKDWTMDINGTIMDNTQLHNKYKKK